MSKLTNAQSIYIHLPFCAKFCHYCDFYKVHANTQTIDYDSFIQNLVSELKSWTFLKPIKTIFIGGGTPNALPHLVLQELLNEIKKYIKNPIIEFSMELNPEFISEEQLYLLKSFGINRVSIGVQSTNAAILKKLNRNNGNNLVNNLKLAQKIIKNVSFDFIFNLPGQKISDIESDLSLINELKPNHLSWYSLILKENTPLFKKIKVLNTENDFNFYQHIEKKLKTFGYKQYEVSSFSITKKDQSLHNLAYWKTEEWIGIGPSACGFYFDLEQNVYVSSKNSHNFLNWSTTNDLLNEKDYYLQKIIMGLRLKEGIIVDEKMNFFLKNNFQNALNLNYHSKLLVKDNEYLKCTKKGLLLLNDVLEPFI